MYGKSLFFGLVSAVLGLTASGSPAFAADTYDIPVITSLTGGGAFLGLAEKQAIELVEKIYNRTGGIHGKPVHFTYHDDQSTPQMTVQTANEIMASRPAVIIGSSLVASCNAMMPLMQKGPMMYCFSPGIHPAKGSFAYTSSVSTADYAKAMIQFFRMKGWTRIAIMTSTDATGQDADRGFDELLALPENKDITAVARVHFNINDVSISAQIATVKAANPQVFIGWATGSPIATIFRGIVQGGLDIPIGTTGGNMTYAQMHQFAAFLPKELYLPSSEWPVNGDPRLQLDEGVVAKQKDFYAAFAEAGLKPDEGAVLAWDPASLVLDALRKLPEGADAVALNDYFQHLKGQAGIDGPYDFEAIPQRGVGLDTTIVTRWNAGADRWEVVSKPAGVPLDR